MRSSIVRFYRFGDPAEVLKVEQNQCRPPESGQVLVRMIATPINPSDLIPIRGAYRHRISLPGIPGYEGVGVVEEIGEGVSPSLLGKRATASIDSIGGLDGTELTHCTQRGGTVLSIGLLSGIPSDWVAVRDRGITAKP